MPLDPSLGIVTNADPQRSGELADIKRRLSMLENSNPTVQILTSYSPYPLRSPSISDPRPGSPGPGSGPPPTTPRPGTMCVDSATHAGYVYLPADPVAAGPSGWWKWALTSP